MATKSNRTTPVRNTNNNGAPRAVRTANRATVCTKVLRQIGNRLENDLCNHLTKTYDEVECIAQTVDALAEKIRDGQISSNQIVAALEKIESRLHAVNGRLNYADLSCATLGGDAKWVADGNNLD